jgi:hypothetical protein
MRACSHPAAFHPASRRSLHAVLGALVLLAFAAAPAAAEPDCPASIVDVERYTATDPFPVDAFVYDSTITFDTWSSAHIRFDRRLGEVAFSVSSPGRFKASLRIVETIDIVGVPPGTPVDATIELRLDGWSEQNCGGSGCGIRFEGKLVANADSVQADANHYGPSIGPRSLAATLSLPVHFVAGVPIEAQFVLDYGTGPGGGAHAEATGSYRVAGLPAGARAIACPGTDVTPVLHSTWGRLKSAYR